MSIYGQCIDRKGEREERDREIARVRKRYSRQEDSLTVKNALE
jgi:hypothetical protein